MFKDTLQISAELIEAALCLHALNFRHKWRIGDQFCVAEDRELFWQNLFADRIYFVDDDLTKLLEELARQSVPLEEEMDKMVFIPRLEDIVDFCAASVFTLELKVDSNTENRSIYRARLSVSSEDKEFCEESNTGLRLAALRALASALQSYLPSGSLPAPI